MNWFNSYLRGRKQRVIVNGTCSNWTTVPSGVPQGSILGPTMFLSFVNDLPLKIQFSKCLMFADDVKIFKVVSTVNDGELLQSDVLSFFDWCRLWQLNVNVDKCFVVNFSLKNKM